MADDPSALVVPFGKHKGLTVAELLAVDKSYADWLASQGWLADRFAALHAAIKTRGAAPDDTPEHNRLQAKFLDPLFHVAFLLTANRHTITCQHVDELRYIKEDRLSAVKHLQYRYDRKDWGPWGPDAEARRIELETKLQQAKHLLEAPVSLQFRSRISFEQNGVDVELCWGWGRVGNDCPIEIKPAIGDDFPSVMRQMARLNVAHLVIEEYSGRAVPFDSVRKMFAANHQKLTMIEEIEENTAEADLFLDAYSSGS